MSRNEKTVFLVDYKCKEAKPGRNVVVAYSAMDAQKLFFKHWKEGYEAGEFSISSKELESIRIEPLCSYMELIGRY